MRRPRDHLAPMRVGAGRRIESPGPAREPQQLVRATRSRSHLLVDLPDVAIEQRHRVIAASSSAVLQLQDRLDLDERQARRLRITDELQTIDGAVVVAPVPGGRSICGQQPERFVVAHRLGGQAALGGEVADSHAASIPNIPADWNLRIDRPSHRRRRVRRTEARSSTRITLGREGAQRRPRG